MIIDLSLSLIVLLILYFRFWKKHGFSYSFSRAVFYMTVVLMLALTVMPIGFYKGILNQNCFNTVNLIPYRDISNHYLGAVKETIENILFFTPFGIMLPFIFKKSFAKSMLISASFSLFIECYQLLGVWLCFENTRTFDITDIINNTIGAAIGVVSFYVYKKLVDKKYSQ